MFAPPRRAGHRRRPPRARGGGARPARARRDRAPSSATTCCSPTATSTASASAPSSSRDPERRKRLEADHASGHPRALQQRVLSRLRGGGLRGHRDLGRRRADRVGRRTSSMDKLVVVLTDAATQLARLMARDGMGDEEAARRASRARCRWRRRRSSPTTSSTTRARAPRPSARCARSTSRSSPTCRPRAPPGDEPAAERARDRGPPAGRARQDARPRPALPARHGRWRTASSTSWRPPRATSSSRSGPGRARSPGCWRRAPGGSSRSRWTLALAARLRERFAGSPHVEIADADARELRLRARSPRSSRIPAAASSSSGNLPYSVGKPILMALVEARAARSTRWRSCSSARWPSAWRRRPARASTAASRS